MTLLPRYCIFFISTIFIISSNDFPVVKSLSKSYINESGGTLFRKAKSDYVEGNIISGFVDDTFRNVTEMVDVMNGFSNNTISNITNGVFNGFNNVTLVSVEKKHDRIIADSHNPNDYDDDLYFDLVPVTFDNPATSEDMLNILMKTQMIVWTNEQLRKYGNQVMRAFCSRFCTSKYLQIPDQFSSYGFECLKCSCDWDCAVFDDCCLGDPQAWEPLYECKNRLEKSIMVDTFYIRKSGCSPNWTDDTTRDLCDAPPSCDLLPVRSKFGMTYRNEYCAICNMDDNYIKWNLDFELMESRIEYKIVLSIIKNIFLCETSLYLKPPQKFRYPSTCDSRRVGDVIKTCNATGRWAEHDAFLEKQCLEYHNPFYYSSRQEIYDNMYCYLCNGNKIGFVSRIHSNSIVALTSFVDPPVTRIRENDWGCNATWSFYNSYQNSCKTIECSEHLEYKEEECVPLSNDSKILHFMMNISSIKNIRQKIKTSLKSLGIDRYIAILGVIEHNIYLHIFCHSKFRYAAKLLSLVKSDWTFGSHVAIHSHLLHSKWRKIWEIISDDVYMSCCKGSVNSTERKAISFEVSDLSICPYLLYDETEFESVGNNTLSLRLIDTNMTFTVKEYQSHNYGKIKICVNTLKEKINVNNSGYIEWYHKMNFYIITVQTIMSILSLVCLALTFITYCTFPVLRTLPAKNNMALIVCLFFAQLSFVASNFSRGGTIICKIIGIFVHYSWLSVFLWMNVCSFHMFTVFRSANAYTLFSNGHFKRLFKYFLFANGTPIIIVTLVITVSIMTTNTIGYGDKSCYLSQFIYVVFSVDIPLLIIIVFNIGFLGMTIYSISKAADVARASGKDRQHMKVYIKLSTFTGLFWTIEMMANFYYPQIFILISSVLNYSLGIFLFLSYVANKRVARLWLSLCRKQLGATTDSKTNSSQTKSTNV